MSQTRNFYASRIRLGYLLRTVTIGGTTYAAGSMVDVNAEPVLEAHCLYDDDATICREAAAYFRRKDGGDGPDAQWFDGLASRIANVLPPNDLPHLLPPPTT